MEWCGHNQVGAAGNLVVQHLAVVNYYNTWLWQLQREVHCFHCSLHAVVGIENMLWQLLSSVSFPSTFLCIMCHTGLGDATLLQSKHPPTVVIS